MTKKQQKIKKPSKKEKLNLIHGEMTTAYDDNNGSLLRTALYKTNDNEVSSDLVQTTFLRTLLYLQRGGKIKLMRGFLKHVLNGLIIDEYRTRSRNNHIVSLDTLVDNGFDPGFNDFERRINFLEGKDIIILIPQLSKKYESAIRLRYLQGLSLKEMAAMTNQSENTVAVQIHRALKKLQKLYAASRLK